jgi:putative heme-binding domain-containing protein
MNPPYLLFYPDANGDDVPDADPVVHLSGFGLQDTHAVANSLTWGPDGWLYGAQGSTCTAKVKVELPSSPNPEPRTLNPSTTDFLGQAIWRYHPERHLFELFAEGGGNTFGVEFDDQGRCYSGTNWGNFRGVHYVQGGYYAKSWGKHGPLTNPCAFGFFDHMPHTGDATRLVHTFSVYGGGLMPELTGKIIGPNPLQSRVQITRREPTGSTFKTIEEAPLLTSDDGWFRPVDLKVGPDGAIYVADFYETRINHVDPRDNWDRSNGRLWRIRPENWSPARPADLSKAPGRDLLARLSDPNRQVRATALRLIAQRQDRSLLPAARGMLTARTGQDALEGLWAVHQLGGLDEPTALAAMTHADPAVRSWAVRLLGDRKELLPSLLAERLVRLAKDDPDPEVRSQLASTARRLPGDQSLPVLRELLAHAGDEKDRHIPLLVWWAVEGHVNTHRDALVELFRNAGLWSSPLVRGTVAQRLARRLATTGENAAENQKALVALINVAPGDAERKILLAGVNDAFEGRPLGTLLPELAAVLAKSGNPDLAVRAGDKSAVAAAIALVANDDPRLKDRRIKTIELLGQVGPPEAVPALLDATRTSKWHSVRRAALSALTRFNDAAIGPAIVQAYGTLPTEQGVRPAALATLLSRKPWALDLLRAVDAGTIPKADVAAEQLARLRQFNDQAIAGLLQKVLGDVPRPTSEQKMNEVARIRAAVTAAPGDPVAGKAVFTQRCAACHVLFKEGGQVGPDLTPNERRNLDFLLVSIVDPSAAIREEYANFRIDTADDQTFVGLIKDRAPDSVTIVDATQQRTVIPKRDIRDERALALSIMPEGLLDALTDAQLRDLFAYLQK